MRCYLKNGNIKEREKRARNEREIDRAKEERKRDINNSSKCNRTYMYKKKT